MIYFKYGLLLLTKKTIVFILKSQKGDWS